MNELRDRVIDALTKYVYANGLPATRDEFAPVADAVLAALGDYVTVSVHAVATDTSRVPGSTDADWLAARRMEHAMFEGPFMSGPQLKYVQLARNLRRNGFVVDKASRAAQEAAE